MTDAISAARSAREHLARGLGALQAPGLPPALANVAEPIARAMGAMHRVEASGGAEAGQQAPVALDALRGALALLQAQAVAHPAIDQAMEAVAGSLGLVHSLTQVPAAAPPAAMPAPAAAAPAWAQQTAPAQPSFAAQYQQPAPAAHFQAAPAAPQYQQPAPAAQYQQPAPAAHFQQPAPAPHYQQPAAFAAPTPAAAPPAWAPAPPAPAAAAAPAPVPAPSGVPRVEAELGAHSATNFYKGLSGNDVIDSGGIFVATYTSPPIGQQLAMKVSMPGGYEFEALAIVRWTRDAPESSAGIDAPPGFGAQFTQISQEGRQLVYRYVRNREPLFHDDL